MSKLQKPGGVNPLARHLSEEEKKNKILLFLQQKREEFAKIILPHLCDKMSLNTPEQRKGVVAISVEMADALLEKLYPIKDKEESK